MVFKHADALSRPFYHHFPPSEHSDAKRITPLGNARHRITPVKAKTFWNLPLHQDPQRKIPRSCNIWTTSRYSPLDPGSDPFKDSFSPLPRTLHKRCKPKLVRVSPAKILQSTEEFRHPASFSPRSTEVFHHPGPVRYVNNAGSSPSPSYPGQPSLPLASEEHLGPATNHFAAPEHPL